MRDSTAACDLSVIWLLKEASGNPPGSDGAAKEATLSWRPGGRVGGLCKKQTHTHNNTLACIQRLVANLLVCVCVWGGRGVATHMHMLKMLVQTDVTHLCIGYDNVLL